MDTVRILIVDDDVDALRLVGMMLEHEGFEIIAAASGAQALETAVEDLHQEMVRLGARIRMFQPEAMDMETAFMKLTEGVTA